MGVLRHPEGEQVGLELKFSRGELGHVARVGLLRGNEEERLKDLANDQDAA